MKLIAEIGVNHNGCVDLARNLIDAAHEAGADCVKFQSFNADKLARLRTPKVGYQELSVEKSLTHHKMLKQLEMSSQNLMSLKKYCEKVGIQFLSTPYDLVSAQDLHSIGCRQFKMASADLVDYQLHCYLASIDADVLISTGMGSLGEIESALECYKASAARITLLHCTSNYPCSDASINLNMIKTLRSAFGVEVGFSDHSIGSEAAIVAASMGASVIEKHFTLDKKMVGPDHRASIEPDELKLLSQSLKRVGAMLGSSVKKVQEEEFGMRQISRKSLVAKKNIKFGDIFDQESFTAMRPGDGLSPMNLPDFIGKRAARDIVSGDNIWWSDLDG